LDSFIGTASGEGYNINIPLGPPSAPAGVVTSDSHGSPSPIGDSDYAYVFSHVVIPVAKEFAPELILVAAGFDAGEHDKTILAGKIRICRR
jgi:histone deacetylase 6